VSTSRWSRSRFSPVKRTPTNKRLDTLEVLLAEIEGDGWRWTKYRSDES
jgi:hypothetical protein